MRGEGRKTLTEEQVERIKLNDKILSSTPGQRILVVWSPKDLEDLKGILHDLDGA